jgi:hypothetical protein
MQGARGRKAKPAAGRPGADAGTLIVNDAAAAGERRP